MYDNFTCNSSVLIRTWRIRIVIVLGVEGSKESTSFTILTRQVLEQVGEARALRWWQVWDGVIW